MSERLTGVTAAFACAFTIAGPQRRNEARLHRDVSPRVARLPTMVLACLTACIIASAPLKSSGRQDSQELPINGVHQNTPCANQPKSLAQLTRVFNSARAPSRSEMTGTWVAIGIFGDARSHGETIADLNCSGLKRGNKYEEVMMANGYAIAMHVIGVIDQSPTARLDRTRSLSFPFDFGGDASPVYRCRLTTRMTLACLIEVYREGVEFKQMPVQPDEIYSCTSGINC
jgi:hypothetical protein